MKIKQYDKRVKDFIKKLDPSISYWHIAMNLQSNFESQDEIKEEMKTLRYEIKLSLSWRYTRLPLQEIFRPCMYRKMVEYSKANSDTTKSKMDVARYIISTEIKRYNEMLISIKIENKVYSQILNEKVFEKRLFCK